MHPILFHIGPKAIHTYGLCAALGFICAILTWCWLGRKTPRNSEYATDLGIWLMLSGIIGARIAFVVANAAYFAAHPLEIIRIDQGGLIFYGGLILASLALILFARRHRQPVFAVADYAIPGLAIGHAIGRIGCFMNGCCYGRPAATACLGITYPPASDPGTLFAGIPLYPVQLFEAGALILLWLLLCFLHPRHKTNGLLFAIYLLVYPPVRFSLEFLRGDARQHWAVLDVAQYTSIALFLAGLTLLFILLKKPTSPR